LPQRLSRLCAGIGARLIQFSSDGVFSGKKGGYVESDIPDTDDIYGISKFLGEVDGDHAITIRCSMIGHELKSKNGLLEWFLRQQEQCRCFTRAIFSGLPSVELARIVRDVVIPAHQLSGLYHVAAKPISKFDLLSMIAQRYAKKIQIVPDDSVIIDRSLNAGKFARDAGYLAPEWPDLIETMYTYRIGTEVK
jgi:dTDP-4-dehydrorhamnose reductase